MKTNVIIADYNIESKTIHISIVNSETKKHIASVKICSNDIASIKNNLETLLITAFIIQNDTKTINL